MNDLVDKIFVINTKQATERMEKVSSHLSELGIEFTRVEAVSTDLLEDVDKSKYEHIDPRFVEGWNINAKSLLETTVGIIKESIDNDYDKILILEDDAHFINYQKGLNALENFLDNYNEWDFIHLNYLGTSHYSFTPYNGILGLKVGCFCCQAYLIKKRVMETYLQELEKRDRPIDHSTKFLHRTRKRGFVVNPKMVDHFPGNYSTIRERVVDY